MFTALYSPFSITQSSFSTLNNIPCASPRQAFPALHCWQPLSFHQFYSCVFSRMWYNWTHPVCCFLQTGFFHLVFALKSQLHLEQLISCYCFITFHCMDVPICTSTTTVKKPNRFITTRISGCLLQPYPSPHSASLILGNHQLFSTAVILFQEYNWIIWYVSFWIGFLRLLESISIVSCISNSILFIAV